MNILQIIGLAIVGLYCLYLLFGFCFLIPEIMWAIIVLIKAPLFKEKKDNDDFIWVPKTELIKQIPDLLKSWLTAGYLWLSLPFLIIYALTAGYFVKEKEGRT